MTDTQLSSAQTTAPKFHANQLPPSKRRGVHKVVSYCPLEVNDIEEMMKPLQPLVRSTKPLTVPKGPNFETTEVRLQRKFNIFEKRQLSTFETAELGAQMLKARKLLKADYEWEREKRIAEKAVYRMAKLEEAHERYVGSPFLTDLLAESTEIEQLHKARAEEVKLTSKLQAKRKKQLRQQVIIKALTEVDYQEEKRKLHRLNLEVSKLEKAYKDVEKTESREGLRATTPQPQKLDTSELSSRNGVQSALATYPAPRTPPPADTHNNTTGTTTTTAGSSTRSNYAINIKGRTGGEKAVYLVEREKEMAERARLEKEAGTRRAAEAQALQAALKQREEEEILAQQYQRRLRQKKQEKQKEELDQRRAEAKAIRAALIQQTSQEIEQEHRKQTKKEQHKQRLAEEWRLAALERRTPDYHAMQERAKSPAKSPSPDRRDATPSPPPPPSRILGNTKNVQQEKQPQKVQEKPPPPPPTRDDPSDPKSKSQQEKKNGSPDSEATKVAEQQSAKPVKQTSRKSELNTTTTNGAVNATTASPSTKNTKNKLKHSVQEENNDTNRNKANSPTTASSHPQEKQKPNNTQQVTSAAPSSPTVEDGTAKHDEKAKVGVLREVGCYPPPATSCTHDSTEKQKPRTIPAKPPNGFNSGNPV